MRFSALKDVQIGCQNLGLVSGEILDISLGGVCVDTGPVKMPANAAVNIRFRIDTDEGPRTCSAHGIVMLHDESGCRLMFDYMDERTHQALRSLVGDWHYVPETAQMRQVADY